MSELRFHRGTYDEAAIDEAIRTFAPHAKIEKIDEVDAWLLRIEANKPKLQRRIVGELGNYALGMTIHLAGAKAANEEASEAATPEA